MLRTGIGYDVHQFAEGRKLFLGGIEIPHPKGLDGHSDADVLIHAIADALLGAMGHGDIGHHFPNNDPRWKDISSLVFLREIKKELDQRDGVIHNIDASVIAEAPKIVPHIDQMKEAMGSALQLPTDRINMKATTNEKMGFVGREEGIAAMATALIDLP